MDALPALSIDLDDVNRWKNLEDLVFQINERIRAHRGEFVLLVENYEESCGYTGFGHNHLKTQFYLGIIEGDALIAENKIAYEIPTDNYVYCWGSDLGEIRLEKGNLQPHRKLLPIGLVTPIKVKNPFSETIAEITGKKLTEIELFVGDEEVFAWPGDDKHKLLALNAMAKKLRRPLTKTIASKVTEIMADQRKAAIDQIYELFWDYFDLVRQIRKSGKPRDVTVPSLSVHDEEEVLISANEIAFFGPLGKMRGQLADLENSIRSQLTEARELGLKTKDIIKELGQRYQTTLQKYFSHI